MIEIIERLLDGDSQMPNRFAQCKRYWDSFFQEHENDTDAELAKAFWGAQRAIEEIFDDRRFGKEAMPVTCFGSLYDPFSGWEEENKRRLAQRLVRAFQGNTVSIEVKSYAKEAAVLFHVPGSGASDGA